MSKFSSRDKSTIRTKAGAVDKAIEYTTDRNTINIQDNAYKFVLKYNIPIVFSSDKKDGPLYDFEEKALELVFMGEEVPPEIIKKLEDTMEERKERNRRMGWDR